jgi:hypothetical protein
MITKICWQMTEDGYELLEKEEFDYSGPIDMAKGGDTAKKQMDQQNKLQQAELDQQNKLYSQINAGVGKYLSGDIGFDPATLASMRSQFQDSNALAYNQAGQGVRDALTARGGDGSLPIGGNYVKGISGLMGSAASSKAAGLQNLAIMNSQQALTNKFNAGSLLSGNAASMNSPISTFGSGASNALNQYMQAANSGFGASFMRGLGGSLGAGIGSFATGGLGGVASSIGKGGGSSVPGYQSSWTAGA